MPNNQRGKSKIGWYLVGLLFLLMVISTIWILVLKMEGEKPAVRLINPTAYIGAAGEISVEVTDRKSGVKKVWIGLLKDGKEKVLLDQKFPAAGFLKGSERHKENFTIQVEPKKSGITDGIATLRIVARDSSWREGLHGNKAYEEIQVAIDTKPPVVDVLSRQHNITQGGAGLVIYRVSERDVTSGVAVGDHFFPGYSGYFNDEDIYMAFFALDHKLSKDTRIHVKAVDPAGNAGRTGFYHYIRKRAFKQDVINISDRFLNWKMPEFDVQGAASQIEKFVQVNNKLRKENIDQITQAGKTTKNLLYWEGAFLRLPNSAKKAGFADHRKYKYKGKTVDEQDHLGIDLASTAHSPIPAANKGEVAFTGVVGIFGKTVVLDHGFGLFSLYSHLSRINVEKGQAVLKGEILGLTGITGFAGGDHLHFGTFVHDTFVNPLEWWDAAWIKNNITNKISAVKDQETTPEAL